MTNRSKGIVTAQLPSGLYQVDVEGAPDDRAHRRRAWSGTSSGCWSATASLMELTPRDLTRGRIVKKL